MAKVARSSANTNAPARDWGRLAKPAIYILGMAPAAIYFHLAVADRLGADPMKALERALGLWSLRFLLIGLAISPLRRWGGISLLRYRRAVGLLAFFYALLHIGVYVGLDQVLDWWAIWRDIVKRPYITVGMVAFAIVLPLAITSNATSIRRMGGAAWQKLHRLVYLAAATAAIHFVMVVKSWPAEPMIYAMITTALIALRLVPKVKSRGTVRTQGWLARKFSHQ